MSSKFLLPAALCASLCIFSACQSDLPDKPAGPHQPRLLPAKNAREGPAWNPDTQTLYYVGANRISRFTVGLSTSSDFRNPAGGANGLLFDPEGRLLACEAASRRVTRTEKDGSISVLASEYMGMKFNSPNDLTIDSSGRVFFTDPRYGPRDSMEMKGPDGALIEGVYRIDKPGKVTRILGRELERPNGILVTPDNKFLLVADNNNNSVHGSRKLWRFELDQAGEVRDSTKTLIFDWKTSRGPDGLKIDMQNRIYVAAGLNKPNPPYETVAPYPAGIYVLSLEGKLLNFVPIPTDEVTNCTFGGPDFKTLFITAGGSLWSLQLDSPGWTPFKGTTK